MKMNELVRVPGLKENYVFRDCWTRLNVKPAKIMQVYTSILCSYMYLRTYTSHTCMCMNIALSHTQQEHVISQLEEYAHTIPVPHDSESILQTVAFLKACNSLFERGILGKRVFIKSMESPIIASID